MGEEYRSEEENTKQAKAQLVNFFPEHYTMKGPDSNGRFATIKHHSSPGSSCKAFECGFTLGCNSS